MKFAKILGGCVGRLRIDRSVAALLAIISVVTVLVLVRQHRQPMPRYGGGAAQYIEHVYRVEAVVDFRKGDWRHLGEYLVDSDLEGFPPMLHVLTGALGGVFGHSQSDVAWTGLLWFVVLALSVGWVARSVSGRWDVAGAALALTFLFPAGHASAVRYYYDLPAAAILWLAVAVFVASQDRRPLIGGVLAGALCWVAANVKWSMFPYGLLVLPGVLLLKGEDRRPRRRAIAATLAVTVAGLIMLAWIKGGGGSQNETLAMRSSSTGAWEQWVSFLPATLRAVAARGLYELTHPSLRQVAWYPVATVFSLLSPLFTVALVPLWAAWAKRRPSWPIVASLVLGPLAFLTWGVAVRDQRFALFFVPGLLLAAALGWGELEAGPRRRFGALAAAAGLLVAAEFHLSPQGFWNAEFSILEGDELTGRLSDRGIFLADSFEKRGWSRFDTTPPSDLEYLEAVWADIERCGGSSLGLSGHVLPNGSIPWLEYRATLAWLEDSGWPTPGIDVQWWMSPDGVDSPPEASSVPHLALAEPSGALLQGDGWGLVATHRYPDPDDGNTLGIFARAPSSCAGGPALASLACEEGSAEREGITFGGGDSPRTEEPCEDLGASCSAPYLRLARSLGDPSPDCAEQVAAIAAAQLLDRQSTGAEHEYDHGERWTEKELASELRSRLDLDAFGSADDRPLTAYRGTESTFPGGTRTDFVLDDPVLGPQRVVLLVPDSPGPHAAVLGLPGHQQSVDEFLDQHGGRALAAAGYVVLVSVFKAYDAGEAEDEAARALLCRGSSLLAVRVAEAQNALRLMRSMQHVCPDRVALLGHSGGSMLVNLLAHLDPRLRAAVTDMTGQYIALAAQDHGPPLLGDETHLGIRSISDRVIRFEGPVQVLEVDYGDPEGLVEFLDQQLRDVPTSGAPEPGDLGGDEGPGIEPVEDLGDLDPDDPRPDPPVGGTLSRRIESWLASDGVVQCRDLAAADLDGDGRDELALATDAEPDRVWEVEGGQLTERWVGDKPTVARGVAWGDLDGDGDPDLAFAVHNGSAPVYRNDGGQLVPHWEGAVERLAKGVAWVDFDNDGDLDLALADSAYSEFIRNDEQGLSSWLVSTQDRRHEDAVTVDLDGDGIQEVAFAVSQPGLPNFEVWGMENGDFAQRVLEIQTGPRASALAFADVDGDHQLDVALARPGDRDAVLTQDSGSFRVNWTSEAVAQTRVVVWWDADRDGDPDLVLGEDGPLALYENNKGVLTLAWRSEERDDTEGLATADVDGDGWPELVTCAQLGAPLRVYRSVAR